MSLFGIVLELFGRFSNEPLVPMLFLIYHSFSILPETLPFDPFCYDPSFKQRRFAAERLPKQFGQNVQVERWERSDVSDVPFIYIYVVTSQINSFFF